MTKHPSIANARGTAVRPRRLRLGRRSEGQSLVEFALVFPIFFTLFLGIVEFAFAFNALLSVNFASRNAALAAAEAGNAAGADCVILSGIESDMTRPGRPRRSTASTSIAPSRTALAYPPSDRDDVHADRVDDLHDAGRHDPDRPVHADPRTTIRRSTAAT